jgi:hypothetical protein
VTDWQRNFRTHPWRFLAALPAGCLLFAFLLLLRLTVRVRSPGPLPERAVIYTSHVDVYAISLAMLGSPRWVLVGDHSILSYMWLPWQWLCGTPVFRFERGSGATPTEQICGYLASSAGALWIGIDSGGPYGVVRPSLIKISERTGRPLVAHANQLSRSVTVLQHQIPLPFCTITPHFIPVAGEGITLSVLQKALDDARRATT